MLAAAAGRGVGWEPRKVPAVLAADSLPLQPVVPVLNRSVILSHALKKEVENLAVSHLFLLLPELAEEEVRHVFHHLLCSYGTETDHAIKKTLVFLEAKAKQLPGKHPDEALCPLLLVGPAVSLGVPGAPSSRFHLLSNLHGAPQ